MFTPKKHSLSDVEYGDMPYTGVAEFEVGVHQQTKNELFSFDIGIGYTGCKTYAQESMEFVHSLLPTNPEFNGWASQREAEFLSHISTTYKNKRVLSKDFSDFIYNVGVDFSTLRSRLYTGIELRVGRNLGDDFGLYSAYSNQLNYKNRDSKREKSIYFVAGINAQYIHNDITLEGAGVDMLHQQAIANIGFSSQYKSLNISLLASLETKRFQTQDRDYFAYTDIMIGWNY